MKYPQNQLETLKEALKRLSVMIDVKTVNPSALHFVVYQQFNNGQSHNWLYCKGTELQRAHKIENLEGWSKLIQIDAPSFELYPNDCNDSNIESAMRKAFSDLGLTK
jgi:hypothetical protein